LFFVLAKAISAEQPAVESKYALLYDYTANEIIFAKGLNVRNAPSSMTKLMTAYIVFDRIKRGELSLDDKFTVSVRAWRQEGSRMFLEPEWKVNVDELLKGLIAVSGNDAAVAIAEGISGTVEDFAALMNETAKKIGMSGTNFINSTGLNDPQHYSTIRDLLILTIAVMDSFPDFYEKYFSLREYRFNNILQKNRNAMLTEYRGTDGVKTGNTSEGGFGLIAGVKRNRQRFISVVNGAENEAARLVDSKKLMDYGYGLYKYVDLAKKGEPVIKIGSIIDANGDGYLYANEDIIYPIRNDRINDLKIVVTYDVTNYGKVRKGERIAKLRFIENDRAEEYDLYASEDVKGIGKISQFLAYFRRNCRRIIKLKF
jgi:D-alanyl-D-alanine carboxypeptidase (penicillin-binding protein 5/6)